MTAPPEEPRSTVIVIEDDQAVRESLDGLFRSVGLSVSLYSSVEEYLAHARPDAPGCMVLDVRLPGKSGLAFYDEMIKAGVKRPVIFISGHADVPMSVRAMKAGAVEFLTKPVRDQELLDSVQMAIQKDRANRDEAKMMAGIRSAYETLTAREREVLSYVAAGFPNRQIAATIGLSEGTVKLHRGSVMHKMHAGSIAELVRISDALGITSKS